MSSPADLLPRVRLLHCHTCKTIEELPDFDGPPDYDEVLTYALSKHRFPNGAEHIGKMYPVEGKIWALQNLREQIISQLKGGSSGLAIIQSDYYDVKDTLSEDALKCYAKHLRPKADCRDYHAKNKALIPDTKAERKEAGLPRPTSLTFLCDFCPVQMWVENQKNERLYS